MPQDLTTITISIVENESHNEINEFLNTATTESLKNLWNLLEVRDQLIFE